VQEYLLDEDDEEIVQAQDDSYDLFFFEKYVE
jgi:hypothetical protein